MSAFTAYTSRRASRTTRTGRRCRASACALWRRLCLPTASRRSTRAGLRRACSARGWRRQSCASRWTSTRVSRRLRDRGGPRRATVHGLRSRRACAWPPALCEPLPRQRSAQRRRCMPLRGAAAAQAPQPPLRPGPQTAVPAQFPSTALAPYPRARGAVLGRFVYALNGFCKVKYDMSYDVSDYWVYEFAKVRGRGRGAAAAAAARCRTGAAGGRRGGGGRAPARPAARGAQAWVRACPHVCMRGAWCTRMQGLPGPWWAPQCRGGLPTNFPCPHTHLAVWQIWGCSQEHSNHIVHEFFKSPQFNDGIPIIPGARGRAARPPRAHSCVQARAHFAHICVCCVCVRARVHARTCSGGGGCWANVRARHAD